MSPVIAIISDEPGWHGKQLCLALEREGYTSRFVSLTDCEFSIGSAMSPSIRLPGFEDRLPDGVFVRGIPGGSLQEVTFYLDILHGLQASGVCVFNDARAIEKTVDKAMTSLLLHQADLPTPQSQIVVGLDAAQQYSQKILAAGKHLVYKPLFGSQGKGIQRIRQVDDLDQVEAANGIYYLQHFIASTTNTFSDWRVFLVNGRAVAAMQRVANHWVTNVAQGASCQPALITPELRELTEKAIKVIGLPYGGIDLICDPAGDFQILEVNSIPAWKGLQSVCEVDISSLLVSDFLQRCSLLQQQKVKADG